MIKRKGPFSIYGYPFAILLSLFIHLLFMTTVEGAVLLGKAFVPFSQQPSITMTTVYRRSVRKDSAERSAKQSNRKTDTTQTTRRLRPNNGNARSRKNNLTDRGSSSPHPAIQRFETFQSEIDQRVQKFKAALADLVTQRRQTIPAEVVMSHVSDLEKIPAKARKDLLPAYLKRMRSKIARKWSQMIQPPRLKSGVATVQYQIGPNGAVSDLRVLFARGEEEFQRSCLAAVREASPFAPLPFRFEEFVEKQYLTITLTFHFRTKDSEELV